VCSVLGMLTTPKVSCEIALRMAPNQNRKEPLADQRFEPLLPEMECV
jgi:hypothetical protein